MRKNTQSTNKQRGRYGLCYNGLSHKKMHIYWDAEGDFLEIRFGKPTKSHYEDLGDDIFLRKDLKTNKIKGYAIFNVQKRKKKQPQAITVDLPEFAKASA